MPNKKAQEEYEATRKAQEETRNKQVNQWEEAFKKLANEGYDSKINAILRFNIEEAIYQYHNIKKDDSNFDGHPSFSKAANVNNMFEKLIKCNDGACNKDTMVSQLTQYYESSTREIKDLFKVASQIYWPEQCSIHVTPTNQGFGHPNAHGVYNTAQCTVKLVNSHGNVTPEFFAHLVHEFKHMLNSIIYQNNAVSYPKLSKEIKDSVKFISALEASEISSLLEQNRVHYEENVIKPVLEAIKSNPKLNKGLYTFLKLYPYEALSGEVDVHCYEFLDKTTRHAAPFSELELRHACSLILNGEHEKFMDEACNSFGICEI